MSLFHLEEYKLVKIRSKCIDIELTVHGGICCIFFKVGNMKSTNKLRNGSAMESACTQLD